MFPITYIKTLIANIKFNCCAKASFSIVEFMEIKICLLATLEVNGILLAWFGRRVFYKFLLGPFLLWPLIMHDKVPDLNFYLALLPCLQAQACEGGNKGR